MSSSSSVESALATYDPQVRQFLHRAIDKGLLVDAVDPETRLAEAAQFYHSKRRQGTTPQSSSALTSVAQRLELVSVSNMRTMLEAQLTKAAFSLMRQTLGSMDFRGAMTMTEAWTQFVSVIKLVAQCSVPYLVMILFRRRQY